MDSQHNHSSSAFSPGHPPWHGKSSRDPRSFAQHCPQVLHEQEQVIGIRGARLELQGFVPAARLVVLGMDEKCPNTGDVGGGGGSEQCVLEEAPSPGLVLAKSGRPRDGQEASPGSGAGPAPCRLGEVRSRMFDCSRRKAVVGEHRQSPAGDIGPGAVGLLVRTARNASESDRVALSRTRRNRHRCVASSFSTGDNPSCPGVTPARSSLQGNRVKRGLSATGRSRIAWKACHWRSSSRKIRRSTRASSAALIPASSRKLRDVLV